MLIGCHCREHTSSHRGPVTAPPRSNWPGPSADPAGLPAQSARTGPCPRPHRGALAAPPAVIAGYALGLLAVFTVQPGVTLAGACVTGEIGTDGRATCRLSL